MSSIRYKLEYCTELEGKLKPQTLVPVTFLLASRQ
jgi:hypothetical protein